MPKKLIKKKPRIKLKPAPRKKEFKEFIEPDQSLDFGAGPGDFGAGLGDLGGDMAVGFSPIEKLIPQDQELFRAFQRNLVSLISHELRTPLTGIANALTVLGEPGDRNDSSFEEMINMAKRNVKRLEHSLSSLLDLVAIESGIFRAVLKEVSLPNLVLRMLEERRLDPKLVRLNLAPETGEGRNGQNGGDITPVLADPQKVTRAIQLAIEITEGRKNSSPLIIEATSNLVNLKFELEGGLGGSNAKEWHDAWKQAWVGFQSGVGSPLSAFGGVIQSEKAFLTRSREGLGSEFLLIHEIMKVHGGRFVTKSESTKSAHVHLTMEFPTRLSLDGIRAVLLSRIFQVSTGVGSVAVVIIKGPASGSEIVSDQGSGQGLSRLQLMRKRMRESLFRASDSVYAIEEENVLVLVMDDCKSEDTQRLLERMATKLGSKVIAGAAHCPKDSSDPDLLLELARRRCK